MAKRSSTIAPEDPGRRVIHVRGKRPIDIDEMVRRIRAAIAPFKKAAMFELAEDGFDSVFEQLVACIISIRTRDETTVPIARRLFEVARTPHDIANLSWKRLDALISASTFHEPKATQILNIAQETVERFNGEL